MRQVWLYGVFMLGLFVVSCGSEKSEAPGNMGPQTYNVIKLVEQPVDLYTDYPATIQGKEDIEIRPKIDGYIETVAVEEGQWVEKGQLLFRISNPQYEQALRNTEAAVEVAEAAVDNARLQVDKMKPLVNKEIVSDFSLQTAQIELKSKEAALLQAKANYANAQVNVGYLLIKSPFEGIVGELPFKLGSYVSSSIQKPLTVISNIQKVYAYFSMNEKQQLNFFREAPGKTMEDKLRHFPAVHLILADGSEYEESGKVETISGQIATGTGSFSVRAGFINPTGLLRSGNSGKVRMRTVLDKALLIPQNATYELQGKRFAYVVDSDGTVKSVELQVREVPGGQYFVADEGLKGGNVIVVEGVATLSDGVKIIPKEMTMPK